MTSEDFTRAFDELNPQIIKFLIFLGATYQEACDLAQDVWLKAWRKRSTLQDQQSFRQWTFSIAARHLIDNQRRWAKQVLYPLDENFGYTHTPPWLRVDLVRFLSKLPPRDSKMLILHHVKGYQTPEIAEMFKIEDNNVRIILKRARDSLKPRLKARGYTSG